MVTLTNISTNYDGINASKGLGIGLQNFTGVTQVVFRIFVRKVGTGTQSWQLWATDLDGVSNGAEIGVITDAGDVADKWLAATFDVNLTGEKLIRVRAKSTVGSDDPIFYGGAALCK